MKKFFIIIVLLGIITFSYFYFFKPKTKKEVQQKSQIAKVTRGDIEVKVLSTGTIQPYTRIQVNSPISGRIDRVEVNERYHVKKGNVLVWISSEDRIALLDAARSGVEDAKKSKKTDDLKNAEEAYQIAEKAYRPVSVLSSISGEVIKRSCEPGQNVTPSNILFVLSDRLVAGVQVDEADIGKISVGQKATIILDAFPEERYEGTVTKISREGTISAGVVMYDVMVDAENVPAKWSSGMTANVEFMVENKDSILVIPRSAITEKGNKKFVALATDSTKIMEIETGITDGKMIEVIKGLNEGDSIKLGETIDFTNARMEMHGGPLRAFGSGRGR